MTLFTVVFQRFVDYAIKNGPNSVLWGIGNHIEFIITNPLDIETILTAKVQTKKASGYEYLQEWLGTGLLTTHGEAWFKMRKILTPAFHFKILENFIDVFNRHNKILVKVLRTEMNSREPINIYKYITQCALDNVCGK